MPKVDFDDPIFTRTVYIDDSSSINSLRYDVVTRTLEIEFNNRKRYQYFAVSPAKFGTLCASDSVGSAFAEIKNTLGEHKEVV